MVLLLSFTTSSAQTPVAENIGFTLGNFKNWTGKTWVYSIYPDYYVNTDPAEGINPSRHVIMTNKTFTDPNTDNKLLAVPPGYSYSARLGNDATGCNHQSLSYKLTVDEKNPLLIWSFAVVMQHPIQRHPESTRPYFNISIKDYDNKPIATCTEYSVISNEQLPGFHIYYPPGYDPADSTRNGAVSPVLWRDWTAVGINLSEYAGKEITLEFTSADCAQGGHYCYAYFVAECRPLRFMIDFCANETQAVLTAPEGFLTYEWLTPDNQTFNGRTLSLTDPIQGADYKCILTSEMGCTATIKSQVYHFNPIIDFNDISVNCDSNVIQFDNLSAFRDNNLNYLWNFGDGTTSTEKNPVHKFPGHGIQNVSLQVGSDITSCRSTISKQVETFSKSDVKLEGENTFCKGETTVLSVSGASHYLWNTGDTTSTLTVGDENVYSVIGYSKNRSCFTDPIVMQITQEPEMDIVFDGKSKICEGDSLLLTASGAFSYLWNTGETTPSIYAKGDSTYIVEGTNKRGCKKTASYITTQYSYPPEGFSKSTDIVDIHHNRVEFNVSQPETGVSYLWDFGDGANATGTSVTHSYNIVDDQAIFNVELKAVNIADCETRTLQKVNVSPFIPNVFSPNNDGKNELFMAGFDLRIFDRNGLELFSGLQGWDGTYQNKKVSPDTYFYIVHFIDFDMNSQTRKGYVTLLR